MAERFYLGIYVISLLVIGIATMITGETYGEARDVHIDPAGILVLLLVYLSMYWLAWHFYKKTYDRMPAIKGFPRLEINKRRIHAFYFCCLAIRLFGLLNFHFGRVGGNVTTSFSFLFNLIKFNEFFPIYYVAARDKKRKLYWANIALYAVVRTVEGWSGWILTVAILELYFRIKETGWIRRFFKRVGPLAVSAAAIIGGGMAYYFMYPLKMWIRNGGNFAWYRLSLWGSLRALVERFCNFAVFTSAWQNADGIAQLYHAQGIPLSEFKTTFLSIVPSFLMRDKEIRPLGNLVKQVMWPDLGMGTGTGFGFLMYWYTLLRCSLPDFLICAVFFTAGLILSFSIIKAFDNEEHDMRIAYFLFLIGIVNASSMSATIGYGYVAALYLIVIMIAFGVIKVRVRRYDMPEGMREGRGSVRCREGLKIGQGA